MEDINQDDSEVLETTETDTETVETTEEAEELTPEQIADLKAKAAKADELEAKNKQLFERAKKAETKPAEAPQQGYSLADIRALQDVHEEDVEKVEKFAKAYGMSIKDARKTDELKAILAVSEEKRSSATASNVSNVRRGPSKVTDEVLLSKADKGQLPDDDEGIERLVAAKAKIK